MIQSASLGNFVYWLLRGVSPTRRMCTAYYFNRHHHSSVFSEETRRICKKRCEVMGPSASVLRIALLPPCAYIGHYFLPEGIVEPDTDLHFLVEVLWGQVPRLLAMANLSAFFADLSDEHSALFGSFPHPARIRTYTAYASTKTTSSCQAAASGEQDQFPA